MFKLNQNPTFKATVLIPVAGSDPAPIVFEFKRWTRSQLRDMGTEYAGRLDEDLVRDIVVGWEGVDQAFGNDALARLIDEFPAAASTIIAAFVSAHTEAKRKN